MKNISYAFKNDKVLKSNKNGVIFILAAFNGLFTCLCFKIILILLSNIIQNEMLSADLFSSANVLIAFMLI